jgi:isopentenyl-diphosphate delta-isomerase
MMADSLPPISERKQDHLDIVLQQDVAAKGIRTGFERFFFEHVALPGCQPNAQAEAAI